MQSHLLLSAEMLAIQTLMYKSTNLKNVGSIFKTTAQAKTTHLLARSVGRAMSL